MTMQTQTQQYIYTRQYIQNNIRYKLYYKKDYMSDLFKNCLFDFKMIPVKIQFEFHRRNSTYWSPKQKKLILS